MADHAIYVTGWSYGAIPELRCTAAPDAPCHIVDGVQVEECNAIEWVDNVGLEDLVFGDMIGPPPWLVNAVWTTTDAGPEFRQAPLTSAQTQGSRPLTSDQVLEAIRAGTQEAVEVVLGATIRGNAEGIDQAIDQAAREKIL